MKMMGLDFFKRLWEGVSSTVRTSMSGPGKTRPASPADGLRPIQTGYAPTAPTGGPGIVIMTTLLILVFLGCYGAFASDGTVNKPWREVFRVFDMTGNSRPNCAGSRFTARTYRNRTTVSQSWSFRNFTSDGNYSMRTYPPAPGEYNVLLSYSGIYLTAFQKTVRVYDPDLLYAADSSRFTNISAVSARRPTNPLLATDSRLPATTISAAADSSTRFGNLSTSVNRRWAAWSNWTGINSRTWSSARAAYLDAAITSRAPSATALSTATWTSTKAGYLDAATSSRAPSTTALTNVTWTDARAANLDASISSRATATGVWSNSARTLTNYSGIDPVLTGSHGAGLWSAAGTVSVLPFQGSVTSEASAQKPDIHVFRGDSLSIPYVVDKNLTGYTVWFGAKANPSDSAYAVPLRDITAYLTNAATGGGLIPLSTQDTSAAPRKYFAEIEIRKAAEVNTPLRFYLWIDSDVIR